MVCLARLADVPGVYLVGQADCAACNLTAQTLPGVILKTCERSAPKAPDVHVQANAHELTFSVYRRGD